MTEVAIGCLASAILTSAGIYAVVIRRQLTKEDHNQICEGKQALVFQALENIKEQLGKQDRKLDRLLFNGDRSGGGRGKST